MTPEMKRIIQESIVIPNSKWRLHPAVPVGLIKRNYNPERDANPQRASPLAALRKKTGGKFQLELAGVPRIVPNGVGFNAVVGATRCELASECNGPAYTVPCEVYPFELSDAEQAQMFVDELAQNRPGVGTKHKIGLVTGRVEYVEVQKAIEALPGTTAVATLTRVYKEFGARNLQQVVDLAQRFYGDRAGSTPGAVLRGMSHALADSGEIKKVWGQRTHGELLQRARGRQSRYGGKGTVHYHVSQLLQLGMR